MKTVRFLRSHQMYQPGETAGFDDEIANAFIAAGVAVDRAGKMLAEADEVSSELSARISVTHVANSPPKASKAVAAKAKSASGAPTSDAAKAVKDS
ncbi:hypothetical protein [Phaeobacter sp. C3_T13_0]|uniref:hypothetical protein n=1 Tax=Phaeobacter cretensis TaxID=3342641 RepID=UPI0039BC9369